MVCCIRSACTTLIAIFLALAFADLAGAQANGNYILGQRGIKGATVPPEGFLFQQDFFWYPANSLKDGSGEPCLRAAISTSTPEPRP